MTEELEIGNEREEKEVGVKQYVLASAAGSVFLFAILYLALEVMVPSLNEAPPAVQVLKVVIPGLPSALAFIFGVFWGLRQARR